jgi:hypothetical protein
MKKIFLNLGKQPITNCFLKKKNLATLKKEFFYNLKVTFDTKTKLVSLKNFVQPKKMFNNSYAHRASMSQTMLISFKNLAKNLKKKYKPKKILEIGSNDGVFIKNFPKKDALAIEPCGNLAKITQKMGYVTLPFFWDDRLAKEIIRNNKKFDLIFSANTISHIPDLNSVFRGISITLSDNGVFIFEDPYILSVIKNVSYDQFYDEHAHVFSIIAINNVITKHKLKLINIEKIDTHGGSIRYYISHLNSNFKVSKNVSIYLIKEKKEELDKFSTYKKFSIKVKNSKNKLILLLTKLKNMKKVIVGYGATYKSATIYNYCNIGQNLINYVIDNTKNKQNKFTPGSHLKIFDPLSVDRKKIDYFFLGAWNFKKEIFNKEKKFIKNGGKFITHVPTVKIIY